MDGSVYISLVTVWVGIKPDSTTSKQAHMLPWVFSACLSGTILPMLRLHFVSQKSNSQLGQSSSPPFGHFRWRPPEGFNNLSTALSLPIARLKTKMQGTIGFYFGVGDDLYAVTACHVLFQDNLTLMLNTSTMVSSYIWEWWRAILTMPT